MKQSGGIQIKRWLNESTASDRRPLIPRVFIWILAYQKDTQLTLSCVCVILLHCGDVPDGRDEGVKCHKHTRLELVTDLSIRGMAIAPDTLVII
jgi:hypothetical protein